MKSERASEIRCSFIKVYFSLLLCVSMEDVPQEMAHQQNRLTAIMRLTGAGATPTISIRARKR